MYRGRCLTAQIGVDGVTTLTDKGERKAHAGLGSVLYRLRERMCRLGDIIHENSLR